MIGRIADDAQRARAEMLRQECAAWVVRVLNLAGRVTAPQLARIARGKWSESSIRQALVKLRLAGLVRKTRYYHHRAQRWESC